MRKIYLTDNFSFDIFSDFPIRIIIDKIDRFEFCANIDCEDLIISISNDSVIQIINSLCGISLNKNKKEIKLQEGDKLYIIRILENLSKDKILTSEEILRLYKNSKLEFFEIIVD